jgi:hypothetical protein
MNLKYRLSGERSWTAPAKRSGDGAFDCPALSPKRRRASLATAVQIFPVRHRLTEGYMGGIRVPEFALKLVCCLGGDLNFSMVKK